MCINILITSILTAGLLFGCSNEGGGPCPSPTPVDSSGVSKEISRSVEKTGPMVFGMSTALTGPASQLGKEMQLGVVTAFDRINRNGGINGRKLKLVALDDGYEPARTLPNMIRLIGEEKVLAVIGNVGTPTAIAALPVALEEKVPFFAAFTGAGLLRKTPPDRYVINVRASYAEETAAMVEHLIKEGGLKPGEFAFFTQRDGYGDAGFFGAMKALNEAGLREDQAIVHGRYERNTLYVEGGLADILLMTPLPKAVILVGTYKPCARFIRLAKEHGLRALFLNVSFVGTKALVHELGKGGEGVIVTQVVPHPLDDCRFLREYRDDLHPGNEPGFVSLEGYIAGRILTKALKNSEGEITREKIVDELERLGEFDFGIGEKIRLGPGEHQALHAVWPVIIRDGRAVPFDWKQLGEHEALKGERP